MWVPVERDCHCIERDGCSQLVDDRHHRSAVLPRWTMLQCERAADKVILHVDDNQRLHWFGRFCEPGRPRPLKLLERNDAVAVRIESRQQKLHLVVRQRASAQNLVQKLPKLAAVELARPVLVVSLEDLV